MPCAIDVCDRLRKKKKNEINYEFAADAINANINAFEEEMCKIRNSTKQISQQIQKASAHASFQIIIQSFRCILVSDDCFIIGFVTRAHQAHERLFCNKNSTQ